MPAFDGLGAFIAFLPGLATRVRAAQQQGRQAAAAVARQTILAEFGEAGWAPLQAATEAARARHGLVPDQPELATGALRDSIAATVWPDGRAAVGVPDAIVGSGRPGDPFRNIGAVAVAQEEGTGTLPARPFLAPGAARAAHGVAAAFVAPTLAALGRNRSNGEDAPHGDD